MAESPEVDFIIGGHGGFHRGDILLGMSMEWRRFEVGAGVNLHYENKKLKKLMPYPKPSTDYVRMDLKTLSIDKKSKKLLWG